MLAHLQGRGPGVSDEVLTVRPGLRTLDQGQCTRTWCRLREGHLPRDGAINAPMRPSPDVGKDQVKLPLR